MTQPTQGPAFARFGAPIGTALVGIGLLVVAFGWNGAAGQLSTLAQVPYLLSGGILGVCLVILGAALIIVNGAREDRARLEAKLDALTDAIAAGMAAGPGAPSAGRQSGPAPQDLAGLVVAGTASYHVPGCRLVDGREETGYLTPAEARAQALKACRVCQPDSAVADVVVR